MPASATASALRTAIRACSASLALTAVAAQEIELSGRVQGDAGVAIARARVELAALDLPPEPVAGRRGRYRIAHGRALAQLRLPATVTDRDGAWRVRLTPAQAALTTAAIGPLELRIRADGHATWRRVVGRELGDRDGLAAARLEPLDPSRRLTLELRGPRADPVRGWVLVERPFRFAGNRAIWLQDVVAIAADGRAAFDEPPCVPGERPAERPTARAEAYRVTVLAADCDAAAHLLAPGHHAVDLEPSPWGARRVLAARAAPAAAPVRATYRIAGRELALEFDRASVPLLGGEPPIHVTTASGIVALDTWDPGVPLFVAGTGERPDHAAAATAPEPDRSARLVLAITDADGAPVFGASVWIDDDVGALAAADAELFRLSDARGMVEIAGLPRGSCRVLAHHPSHGEREGLVDLVAAPERPLSVRLPGLAAAHGGEASALEGSLLLDLRDGTRGDRAGEIGIVTADGRVVRREFDPLPELVRIDGLVVGPARGWVRVGDAAAVLLGGVLATPPPSAALRIADAERHDLVVRAIDRAGAAVESLQVSLGEVAPAGSAAPTLGSVPVEPDLGAGTFGLSVRSLGLPWLRLHGPGASAADLRVERGRVRYDVVLESARDDGR